MSHRCPECGCTVLGGDWSGRPCWMCEDPALGFDLVWGAILLIVLLFLLWSSS